MRPADALLAIQRCAERLPPDFEPHRVINEIPNQPSRALRRHGGEIRNLAVRGTEAATGRGVKWVTWSKDSLGAIHNQTRSVTQSVTRPRNCAPPASRRKPRVSVNSSRRSATATHLGVRTRPGESHYSLDGVYSGR